MADFNFPDLVPNTVNWEYQANVGAYRSTFTKHTQTTERMGHKWLCSLNFTNLTQDQSRLIRYLEIMSKGGTKTVLVPMFGHRYSGKSITTNVKYQTSQLNGLQIVTTGWTPLVTVVFAGDIVSVNGEPRMVTSTSTSDSGGGSIINIDSPLRKPLSGGETITYNTPLIEMRRTIGQSAGFSLSAGSEDSGALTAVSLGFEEAIYV